MSDIQTIGVVGAGTMGHGIAQVAAAAGYQTRLCDIQPAALEKGLAGISKSLDRMVKKEKISEPDKADVLSRISTTSDLADLADCQLVVEAVVERLDIKTKVLSTLDEVCPADTILATNTSSISITRLAAATSRPEKVIGMHFMNPVPVMKLVEVIRGLDTDDETYNAVDEHCVAQARQDARGPAMTAPGFVANRILMPIDQRGHLLPLRRRGRAGGHRRSDEARHESPHGPPGPGGSHRPRCLPRYPAGARRRFWGSQIPPLPAPGEDGRRRTPRTQIRPRFLQLQLLTPEADPEANLETGGSRPRPRPRLTRIQPHALSKLLCH